MSRVGLKKPLLQQLSKSRFDHYTQALAEDFGREEGWRNAAIALAGSEKNARVFLKKGGMSIGVFSKMVELPVSTVRHYIRLGLVEPWKVEGRYRFQPVNVRQVEVVRMWCDLGYRLEEIAARRATQRQKASGLMLQDLIKAVPNPEGHIGALGIAFVQQEVSDKSISTNTSIWSGTPIPIPNDNSIPDVEHLRSIMHELLEEYRAAREKLEAKKLELDRRIERARELEENLAKAS